MKDFYLISLTLFIGLITISVSAEERRNQYSNSLMFQAPDVHEDPDHKTESEQHNQMCRDLQKQINELKNKPIRRNAASERYQAECLGN